jgi:UDP-N-acetylglucosamine 2-epimerase (non-hydrolysing)
MNLFVGGVMKIILVAGTRANFMKIAPIMSAIKRFNQSGDSSIEAILVHTGRRYDTDEAPSFFDDLNLPKPDINLGVFSGSRAEQTGNLMIAFEQVLQQVNPELVVVAGDVNATLVCTITAKKLKIPVAHIEAGLRSEDLESTPMINRKLTDFMSDYLFTTDLNANANLIREGISDDKIFFVGNVMAETLFNQIGKAAFSSILNQVDLREGLEIKPFGMVVLHSPSTVDNRETLSEICEALSEISQTLPLVCSSHPHIHERIRSYDLEHLFGRSFLHNRMIMTHPMCQLDSLHLNSHAEIILTDSGKLEEEATILGVPCLTLRNSTERPITITEGTNRLVGTKKENIIKGFHQVMSNRQNLYSKPEKWDGHAADRIIAILADNPKKRVVPDKEEKEWAVLR